MKNVIRNALYVCIINVTMYGGLDIPSARQYDLFSAPYIGISEIETEMCTLNGITSTSSFRVMNVTTSVTTNCPNIGFNNVCWKLDKIQIGIPIKFD